MKNFKKVEILKYNPLDPSATFSDEEQTAIAYQINDPEDVRKFIAGKSLEVQVDTQESQDSQKHYSVNEVIENIFAEEGYLLVIPGRDIDSNSFFAADINSDRIIDWGKVTFKSANEKLRTKLFGRVFLALKGLPTLLSPELTILNQNSLLDKPGIADEEAGKIIYSDSYHANESLDSMMGIKYIDE